MAGNYVLYEHRNKVNGKRYIGVTNSTAKRWKCCNGEASHTHGLKWEYMEV